MLDMYYERVKITMYVSIFTYFTDCSPGRITLTAQ